MDVIRVRFPSVLKYNEHKNITSMVDDKVARRSLWVGELACSSRAYHIKRCHGRVVMRGTVNTFYRGSIPLDTLKFKSNN